MRCSIERELRQFSEAHSVPDKDVSFQVREILECAHKELFSQVLNVRMLRTRCHISDNNISCRFKQEMGVSIKEYVESLRLGAACDLLRQNRFRVAEVAHAVGYQHLQTFHAAFTRRFGFLPGSLHHERDRSSAAKEGAVIREPGEPMLTDARRQTLVLAMERVLPAGRGPGATEAHAIGYVDWYARQNRLRWKPDYFINGLDLIESIAQGVYGKSLAACSNVEQDAVLTRVHDTPHPNVQRFFSTLVRMTISGFLCAPEYGGNRNMVGWTHMGFTPHVSGAGVVKVRGSGLPAADTVAAAGS